MGYKKVHMQPQPWDDCETTPIQEYGGDLHVMDCLWTFEKEKIFHTPEGFSGVISPTRAGAHSALFKKAKEKLEAASISVSTFLNESW